MATIFANAGKAIASNRMKAAGTEPLNIAWGTGVGTAAITDTTLFTEGPEARVAGTSAQATTTVTNDTYRVTGTITASAGRTPTNAGTFDVITASSGNLFVKGDFTGVVLNSGESIAFTVDLKFA